MIKKIQGWQRSLPRDISEGQVKYIPCAKLGRMSRSYISSEWAYTIKDGQNGKIFFCVVEKYFAYSSICIFLKNVALEHRKILLKWFEDSFEK